ncbi:MAG: hypothetical protein IPK58_16925 [Acidobacteria bacterium]|nr:hypothetical protein [Acidobacteriota bacterium]
MGNYRKIIAVAGVAVAFLFAFYSLATAPRFEIPAAAQATVTPENANSVRKEYREAVLKRMEMGDRVAVPEDRIGYLEGDVKLVNKQESVSEKMTTKSLDRMPKISAGAEIERIAGRFQNPEFRDGLKAFARNAADDRKIAFLNGGKFYLDDLNAGAKAVPRPTEDPEKKCRESCERIFNIVCKEICEWDCRIVNGEKVCEKSCKTICPEIENIVCKKLCD